jgi:hypothetical protein
MKMVNRTLQLLRIKAFDEQVPFGAIRPMSGARFPS